MKSNLKWIFWGGKTFVVSVCASFLAFLIARILVWLLKRQAPLDFNEVVCFSVNASWRLGSILTIVAIVLVLIGSFNGGQKK
ncbi:hypothetical protein [Stutzerimonas tarimensis]|uniref:Uncharacterized protein n=1 Tax=Stutzerimonas tarimensis TaxID=1507735 RepID=A0ABV7TBR1_9GAMM